MAGKIAIIPARGGSKRIPRKNVKSFCGRPIISYVIETTLKSSLFDEVMVSTDDQEIADMSRKYGANVPFMRSDDNSTDLASTIDVLKEVVSFYESNGKKFEVFCCLYPTSALVEVGNLVQAHERFLKEEADFLASVVKYSHPIQRALMMKNGSLSPMWPEAMGKRTQDLETSFHDAGQFYFGNINKLKLSGSLFEGRVVGLELSQLQVQDIDNEDDWMMAELKYKLKNK
jgi:pseudaminic acid cytidylyltransferase